MYQYAFLLPVFVSKKQQGLLMTETPYDLSEAQGIPQAQFETISQLVASEFQVEEALLDHGTPTYYLK